jgi:hypothetical protein
VTDEHTLPLSDAQLDELAARVAARLDRPTFSRRQALAAGAFGLGTVVGGGTVGALTTGREPTPATASDTDEDGALVGPDAVQSALLDRYEAHGRGTVRLDPRETYALADVQVPPYVTLDLNGALVRPARDANVFEVAPAGHVTNGVVDASETADFGATVVSADNEYWRAGPGADVMAGPDAPGHDLLYDSVGKPLRWRCRGPAANLFLHGPTDRDSTSTGLALVTAESGIAFQDVANLYVYGFGTGVALRCDAPEGGDGFGFVNGNAFDRLFLDSQTDTALRLHGTDPDVNANNFLNLQIQPDPRVGSDGTQTCVFVGTGEANRFLGHVWDPQKVSAHSLWFAAASDVNAGAGDENVFVTNEKGLGGLRAKVRNDAGVTRSGFVGHAEAVGL